MNDDNCERLWDLGVLVCMAGGTLISFTRSTTTGTSRKQRLQQRARHQRFRYQRARQQQLWSGTRNFGLLLTFTYIIEVTIRGCDRLTPVCIDHVLSMLGGQSRRMVLRPVRTRPAAHLSCHDQDGVSVLQRTTDCKAHQQFGTVKYEYQQHVFHY
jgi:hypothetical protein